MIRTTRRSSSIALAIAALLLAPHAARADDQAPPPPGPPPPGYPPPYQPPGNVPPAPPPPPGYGPPGYGPQVYSPQPYSPQVYGPNEIADVDDSQPVPYGYTRVTRARKGLIIGGAATLGATYLVSVFAAAVADDVNRTEGNATDTSSLWVPVAGPFLETGKVESSVAKFYLVALGLGQTAGAVMLFYGLSNPRTLFVRNDQLSIVPVFGNGSSGLAVSGRF